MTGNAKDLVLLAVQCLNEAPDSRPTMNGVSETVKGLKDRSPDVDINIILYYYCNRYLTSYYNIMHKHHNVQKKLHNSINFATKLI